MLSPWRICQTIYNKRNYWLTKGKDMSQKDAAQLKNMYYEGIKPSMICQQE